MAARSGQITVTTAGTAVVGTSTAMYQGFYIRALSTNTGKVYVGNDGANDVTSGNGYELSPGEDIYIECQNLAELYFDAATNGDKFCWIAVHVVKNFY
jgi:hypothetical protein